MVDDLVADKKQVEKIQPQVDNYTKVQNNFTRLMMLNQSRKSVKISSMRSKQKEASDKL